MRHALVNRLVVATTIIFLLACLLFAAVQS